MYLYKKHRPQIKTGDVIAFSGNSRISKIIKWKTRSRYSHVGLVWRTDLGLPLDGENVMLIESTTLNNLPDAATGEFIKGIQLQWLSKRLATYNGEAWWGKVNKSIPNVEAAQMWLRQKHNERTRYDAIQALGAGADLLDWIPGIENDPDFNSLFCSELVARAWQYASLLGNQYNASEMTPKDIMDLDFIETYQLL